MLKREENALRELITKLKISEAIYELEYMLATLKDMTPKPKDK